MTVIVRDMKMPTSCETCPFLRGYYCWADTSLVMNADMRRPKLCPLFEIKQNARDPHES